MIFNALHDAARRGELLLVDSGLCHYHLLRNGQVTIREIIVLPERQGQGIGTEMVERLAALPGATILLAKCPTALPANEWYWRRGFTLARTETTRSGGQVHVWVRRLG